MKLRTSGRRSGRLSSVTCSGKPADLASNPSGVDSIPSKARTIRKSCTSPSVEPFIVWRKHVMPYMKPDTGYMKEALASDRRVKYCRIVRRTLKGVRRRCVQLVVEGLPPVRKVYAPKCEVVGIDPGPSRIAYFHEQSGGHSRGCTSRGSERAEDSPSAAQDRPFKTSEQSRQLQSRRNREKGFVDLEHEQSRTQDGGKACRAPSVPGGHPQARPR